MGTSIGASMAWWLAAKHPDRVATLVCINIPHPGALAEGREKTAAPERMTPLLLEHLSQHAR